MYVKIMIIEMPEKFNKILNDNHGEKFIKVPFIIYADLESLLEKTNTYRHNPEKSSTTKINKPTQSGYSCFTHCSFESTKYKPDYYRGKNRMKNFCLDLKEHATKIINYEKKRNDTINKERREKHNKQKVCYIYI